MRQMRMAGFVCLTFFALLTLGFGIADTLVKSHTLYTLSHTLIIILIGTVMLAASLGLWVQRSVQVKLRRNPNSLTKALLPGRKHAAWSSANKHRPGKPIRRIEPLGHKHR